MIVCLVFEKIVSMKPKCESIKLINARCDINGKRNFITCTVLNSFASGVGLCRPKRDGNKQN